MEEIHEVTASLAAAIEISSDAAAAAVLSELDGVFILKEEKNSTEGSFSLKYRLISAGV